MSQTRSHAWRRARGRAAVLLLLLLAGNAAHLSASAQEAMPQHALTLLDQPKYPSGFQHLDYVNIAAPKGGAIVLMAMGSYDSFNPFILKGDAALMPGVFETLTTGTEDDPGSEYGLIAQSITIAPDRSWAVFTLRPEAKWHDGQPITAEDVVFSFDILKTKGSPNYRFYYAQVENAQALDPRRVKFTFGKGASRETPVIIGQLPILPKHDWTDRDFDNPSLRPPLGSGPYRIAGFDAGRSVTLERVEDYWGKALPLNVGRYNFQTIRYDYYRDATVALEAFKAGGYDFRIEPSAKNWATAYAFPASKDGRVILERVPNKNPSGMQGFAFNLRRPIFADRQVRAAISYAFDFEWSNKALFYGEYQRTHSYFENSALAAQGLPSSEELKILEPFRGKIPDEVFTGIYQPPQTDGSGNARDNLVKAASLLDAAGWRVVNGKRMKDGVALSFEILLGNSLFERVLQPFAQNLAKIGIDAKIRIVDSAQYEARIEDFDYDMIVETFGQSLSPGNEQRDFWGSASAKAKGGRNTIGINDPVVDFLVDGLIAAQNRQSLVTWCHALDRVLQWNYFMIPNWHLAAERIAYWNKFGHPEKFPDYGIDFNSWWIDPAKAAALKTRTAVTQTQGQPVKIPTQATASAQETASAKDRGTSPVFYALGAIGIFIAGVLTGRGLRKRAPEE